MTGELRHRMVAFVRSYYAKSGQAPSVRAIADAFKAEGVNTTSFYKWFPGGLEEACRAAGVPVPEFRLRQSEGASEARRKPAGMVEATSKSMRLVLSEAQTRRLYGLSHLEGGKDPLIIVDELLSLDAELRGAYKLSMKDTRLVADFLKAAAQRGWSTTSNPNLLDYITQLWNLGFQRLDPGTVDGLAEILRSLRDLNWDPGEFVTEAGEARGMVNSFFLYKQGSISAEEFRRRVVSST